MASTMEPPISLSADAVRDEGDQKQRDWEDEGDGEAALESLSAKGRPEPFHEPFIEAVNRNEISAERG